MTESDDSDRQAILARREHFVVRALGGHGTKVAALALSGLATACPCLKVAAPPPPTSEGEEPGEDEAPSETSGGSDGETGGVEDGSGTSS